jgi:hypothetical protein
MTEEKPELHPVVDLFLRRAESHPEEIANGRWGWVLDNIQHYGSEAERAAVLPVSNKIMLDNIHKNFMRELLNPEQLNLFSVGSVDADINPLKAQNLWKKLGKL